MEQSRNIPASVSREVKEKHFLECAWDGTRLIEQHHIEEYHLGGLHTVENLILLCPNCHTQVHCGEITEAELRDRQTTHVKGDRRSISVPFDIQEPVIKLGGSTFERTPILVQVGNIPMLSYKVAKNGEILFSARMHDRDGGLIFWMSDNRVVMPSCFKVETGGEHVKISDNINSNQYLEIWQDNNGILNVLANTYVGGIPLTITPDKLTFNNHLQISGMSVRGANCAFSFGAPIQMNRKSILLPIELNVRWPPTENQVIFCLYDKNTTQRVIIGLKTQGQIVFQVFKENNTREFISQHLKIPLNCAFNLNIEIYPSRIEIFVNDSIIFPANSYENIAPVHLVKCLDTSAKTNP